MIDRLPFDLVFATSLPTRFASVWVNHVHYFSLCPNWSPVPLPCPVPVPDHSAHNPDFQAPSFPGRGNGNRRTSGRPLVHGPGLRAADPPKRTGGAAPVALEVPVVTAGPASHSAGTILAAGFAANQDFAWQVRLFCHAGREESLCVPRVVAHARGPGNRAAGNDNIADAGSVALPPADSSCQCISVGIQGVARGAVSNCAASDPSHGAVGSNRFPSAAPNEVVRRNASRKRTGVAAGSKPRGCAG